MEIFYICKYVHLCMYKCLYIHSGIVYTFLCRANNFLHDPLTKYEISELEFKKIELGLN